jgi:hypothetical protein
MMPDMDKRTRIYPSQGVSLELHQSVWGRWFVFITAFPSMRMLEKKSFGRNRIDALAEFERQVAIHDAAVALGVTYICNAMYDAPTNQMICSTCRLAWDLNEGSLCESTIWKT